MKINEQKRAIKLRKQGWSITKIAEELSVSKGSVSAWVRDVELSSELMSKIKNRSHAAEAVEKRRLSRLKKENTKRDLIINLEKKKVGRLSKRDLFMVGVALYWGEGSKKKRGVVEFTNSDPGAIILMRKFLIDFCEVSEDRLRGHVYIHEHLSVKDAEKYWSDISKIPLEKFHKTSIQHNRKVNKKDTLPFGTFAILVCDTNLRLRMEGWMRGLGKN